MTYTLLDVEYSQSEDSVGTTGSTTTTNISAEAIQLTTVACIPSYRIVRAQLSNDTTSTNVPVLNYVEPQTNRTLAGFNGTDMWVIYNGVSAAVSSSAYATAGPTSFPGLFTLMALSQNSTDFRTLLRSESLKNTAQAVFQGIMSQWIQSNLMSETSEPIIGTATYTSNRLHVVQTSVWVMIAGFALLLLATIVVWYTTRQLVVSRDPNTIGAIAAILARSNDVDEVLYKVDAHSEKTLERGLSFVSFGIDTTLYNHTSTFKVLVAPGCSEATKRWKVKARRFISVIKKAATWPCSPLLRLVEFCNKKCRKEKTTDELPTWRPFTLRLPVIVLTFVLPMAVIVVLEVLQRSSDHNNGITNVAGRSEEYIRYIPALIMLLVATLFNSLDFNISTFAPYSRLYIGEASARSTMNLNLLGRVPPDAIFKAARVGHIGAATSIAASLIGSLLTIIVSGLYVTLDTEIPGMSRTLYRLDTFNTTWNNNVAGDNYAAAVLSLIDNMNLSYPDFTYSEIALPRFSLGGWSDRPAAGSIISGAASASMLALRGSLKCVTVEKSNMTIWTTEEAQFAQFAYPGAYVNVSISLPDDCHPDVAEGSPTQMSSYINQFQLPESGGAYAGALLNLNYGACAAAVTYPEGWYIHPDSQRIGDNPPGCPSLAFTFGYFEMNSIDTSNVTTVVCYQEMQVVEAKIMLYPNSTQIDARSPPVVSESSVRTLQVEDSNSTAFQYRIKNNLHDAFGIPETDTLDTFFQIVTINGSESVSPELLVGSENEQRLFGAINHFYRKYMAQVINANMRGECNTIGNGGGLIGTCRSDEDGSSNLILTANVSIPRLFQSTASKLTLQIMLGVMAALAMFAFWFTKMRNLLPYNPCSIAGTMGLLAGGELVSSRHHHRYRQSVTTALRQDDRDTSTSEPVLSAMNQPSLIPIGSEWASDKKLGDLLSRWTYSLQWWRHQQQFLQDGQLRYGYSKKKRYGIDIKQGH